MVREIKEDYLNMKKRLKYEKYNNSNDVITIDLHNEYTVIAIIGLTDNVYTTTLFLKDNVLDNWMLCEKAERITFKCKPQSIYAAILKRVSELNDDNFFDYYIKRCEYESKAFEIGDKYLKGQGI